MLTIRNKIYHLFIYLFISFKVSATCLLGGSPAEPGQFPFSVSLQIDNVHYCGASIINEQYLLSAAGCIRYIILKIIRRFPFEKNFINFCL